MFKRFRRMIRPVTDFAAPTPPDPEVAGAVVEGLAAFRCRDPPRYRELFLRGRPARAARADRALFAALDRLGVTARLAGPWHEPRVRLFPFEDMYLATDLRARKSVDQVFGLMSEQVYFVQRFRVEPGEQVLEIGAGSGVNSLVAAARGAAVVATDVNPRAVEFARFNAALNGRELDVREGSLFAPVADREFDVVLTNPPFEPAPPDAEWPLHSHGGEDGLSVVRALLARLPDHLARGGRLEMITWTTAGDRGLEIVPLLGTALPDHGVRIEVLSDRPLGPFADRFRDAAGYREWRARLAERSLDRVVMVFVRTWPEAEPTLTIEEPEVAIAAARAIADEW